jgi:hypothetical protein
MIDTKNFWHISEYTLSKKMRTSYVTYGDFIDIKNKLEEKKVKFTITAIKPKDFRKFKKVEDI